MKANALIINERDNVAVVLEDIPKGGRVLLSDGREMEAREEIPCSHKIALVDMAAGTRVIKYGEVIGLAGRDIPRGSWVHTHNLVGEG